MSGDVQSDPEEPTGDLGHPVPAPDDEPAGTPTLFEAVYGELHRLAASKMRRERSDHTLQTTALVNEVYLRLMKQPDHAWASPRQFYAAAAESMRRILIEQARARDAQKRGGGKAVASLDESDLAVGPPPDAVIAVDEALAALEKHDARSAEVVMLRYFAGLSVEETAAAMELSPRTVKREWSVARAWLNQRMSEQDALDTP